MSEATSRVRAARRTDALRVAELRFWHLAETARLEPRLRLSPDARERIGQSVAAWLSQEDRVVVVAESAAARAAGGDAVESGGPDATVVGYATGLLSVWPPILRAQRVGEVSECFVVPGERGRGVGRALLDAVVADLSARGADVLRAPVPTRNEWAAGVFRALGFEPHLRVLERPLGTR
jgi:ribosomal protein S18 acetylase RimI-like enzyme